MPTALILGASSDMAIAIAKKFAASGYDLQLASRNVQRLEPLKADLGVRFSRQVELLEFDALRPDTHGAFFNGLSVKPEVTICVFGYMGDNEVAIQNWEETARVINTNYTGAVSILNVAAQYYISQKKGTIVGISSVAGERGRQSNYIYGSAKAGFSAYLSGLRNRLFREGVHVVSVKPGFVYTRMTENLQLPGLLTAKPEAVGDAVYSAVTKKKNNCCTPNRD